MVEKTILKSGELTGRVDRHGYRPVVKWEVYSADFYGRGAKRYLHRQYFTEFVATGHRVMTNASDDGHEGRIDKFLSEVS